MIFTSDSCSQSGLTAKDQLNCTAALVAVPVAAAPNPSLHFILRESLLQPSTTMILPDIRRHRRT